MNCEMYKNYQVFMTFDTLPDDMAKYAEYLRKDGYTVNITQNFGVGKVQVASESATLKEFSEVVEKVRALIAHMIYSEEEESLEEKFVKMCLEKGIKVNVAESITGGLVCSKIVSVSGSSAVLHEGLVTYTDTAKLRRLHVKAETFENYGAISRECCLEMLDGLKNKDVSLSIATTGCAGPTSDEKDTPVGEVYIGVKDKFGSYVDKCFFRGMRNYIREITANYAIFIALKQCEKY